MRRFNTTLTFLQGCLIASCLVGCHSTSGQSTLISPLVTTSTTTPGEIEKDLSAPESAKLCFAAAESLEKGGKDAEALGLYEKARHLDRRFATQATRRLAVLYDRNGQFDKALDEYRNGLKENPKDADLLNDLGYGYYCRGEWAAAEQTLRKAVAADPKKANAWNNLGMTLAQQGNDAESLQAFEKAVSKAQAHCNLAFIQVTRKNIDQARENYVLALKLEPGLQIARVALNKLNQPASTGAQTTGAANPPVTGLPEASTPALDTAVTLDATGRLTANP